MSIVHITEENFQQLVMQSENTVLLDFWAEWCGPCRMIAPYIDEIAEEYPDIAVGKIDVDKQPALAARFGIVSIPTLIVMEKGEPVAKALGYRPKADILKLLEL